MFPIRNHSGRDVVRNSHGLRTGSVIGAVANSLLATVKNYAMRSLSRNFISAKLAHRRWVNEDGSLQAPVLRSMFNAKDGTAEVYRMDALCVNVGVFIWY